jgi:hypothetical protein
MTRRVRRRCQICEALIDALSLAECGPPAIVLGGTQKQPRFWLSCARFVKSSSVSTPTTPV